MADIELRPTPLMQGDIKLTRGLLPSIAIFLSLGLAFPSDVALFSVNSTLVMTAQEIAPEIDVCELESKIIQSIRYMRE
jgi:hypothetical protein